MDSLFLEACRKSLRCRHQSDTATEIVATFPEQGRVKNFVSFPHSTDQLLPPMSLLHIGSKLVAPELDQPIYTYSARDWSQTAALVLFEVLAFPLPMPNVSGRPSKSSQLVDLETPFYPSKNSIEIYLIKAELLNTGLGLAGVNNLGQGFLGNAPNF